MEKLLFFGLTDAEFQKIKPVASRLKLHCEQIPVSMYHNTLGVIASGRAVPAGIPAAPGTPVPASLTAALGADAPAGASAVSAACGIPEAGSTPAAVSRDRLLVMCQLPERRMDKLLFELRRIDAPHRLQGCTHAHKRRMDDSTSSHGNALRKSRLHRKKPLKGLSQ